MGSVEVFEPTALGYTFVRKIHVEGAFDLAVDGGGGESNGEIYVTKGFEPTVIDQFSSTGAYLGHITGVDSPGGDIRDVYSLAVDPASHDVYIADNRSSGQGEKAVKVFGPDIVLPTVTTEPVSEAKARSATLTGTVNPEKAGAATCKFVWGSATELGHTAPCEPEGVAEGEKPVPVKARIGGLAPDTEYCYRLQATDANGTNPGEASQEPVLHDAWPGIEPRIRVCVGSDRGIGDVRRDDRPTRQTDELLLPVRHDQRLRDRSPGCTRRARRLRGRQC